MFKIVTSYLGECVAAVCVCSYLGACVDGGAIMFKNIKSYLSE